MNEEKNNMISGIEMAEQNRKFELGTDNNMSFQNAVPQQSFQQQDFSQQNFQQQEMQRVEPTVNYNSYNVPPNDDDGRKKGSITKLVVIIFILIALLGVVALGASLVGTSKVDKFKKLLVNNGFTDFANEFSSKVPESGTSKVKYIFNFEKLISDMEKAYDEEYEGEIPFETITIEEITQYDKKDFDGTIKFIIDDSEIIVMDVVKTGDLIGFAVEDLFEDYIAIENNNLRELAEKFGMDEDDIEELGIPDRIDENMEFINEEQQEQIEAFEKIVIELEKELDKYVKIVDKHAENNITVEKGVEVEINGEKIKATKHTFKFDVEFALNVVNDALPILKEDEELFNVFVELCELAELDEDDIPSFEDWQELLEEFSNELEDANEEWAEMDEDEKEELNEMARISFEIYENKNSAVRYVLKSSVEKQEASIILDTINNKENALFALNVDVTTEVPKYDYFTGKYEILTQNIESGATINVEKDGDKYIFDVSVMLDEGSQDMELDIITLEFEISDKIENDLRKVTKDNAFILNDASEDEMEEKLMKIEDNFESFGEKILDRLPKKFKKYIEESTMETMSKANWANFVNDLDNVEWTFLYDGAINFIGKQAANGNGITNAQAYNYLAKGATRKVIQDNPDISEDVMLPTYLAKSIPCTRIEPKYAKEVLGIELPVIKVNTYKATDIEASFFVTNTGDIFIWPPYEYDGKYWVNFDTQVTKSQYGKPITEAEEALMYEDGFTFYVDNVAIKVSDSPKNIATDFVGNNNSETIANDYSIFYKDALGAESPKGIETDALYSKAGMTMRPQP